MTTLRVTKTDLVYRRLRQMIIDLELAPGQAISKDQMSALFDVSRAPVSEALARLSQDDLVRIMPQHGTFVQPITLAKLREGLFFRRSVEPLAIAHLAPRVTDDLLDDLRQNLARQKSAVDANDFSALHSLDDAFHKALLDRIELDHTAKVVHTLSAHLERARNLVKHSRRKLEATLHDHTEILDALEHRDPIWARDAMGLHLSRALAPLADHLDHHPEIYENAGAADDSLLG